MKVCLVSLGCPKNLTDTEVLMGKLSAAGHQITTKEKEADFFIVNTCAFLKSARDEAVEVVGELKKYKRQVFLAGCLPKWDRDFRTILPCPIAGTIDSIGLFDCSFPRIKATPPWTAYVKIAEGCSNRCSYCLIPKLRGRFRFRPAEDILAEIKTLAQKNVREIIYVAQDTAAHPELPLLLKKTVKIKEIKWVRVMYAHPAHVTGELIDVIASEEKICKYLDLPIQHISDKILEGMNRPEKVPGRFIYELLFKIREAIKGITIRTSLIVGFPGETDSEFSELLDFIDLVKFERLGVFKYSREKGTPAAIMKGQVPEKIKEARFQIIMAKQKQILKALNKGLIGQVFEVLCEGKRGSYFTGRTPAQAPEIDGLVRLKQSGSIRYGRFVHAQVVSASAYDLTANVIT